MGQIGKFRARKRAIMAISFDTNYTMTIDGREARSAETLPVVNPATEEIIATAPDCSHEQLEQAVAAAGKAFVTWKARPIAERQEFLRKVADRLEASANELAALMTNEQGKPLADANGEIVRSAVWFREFAKKELPVTVYQDESGRRFETRHVPLGVVGAITPWNFPVALGVWKVAPALLAGNTIILKPSPFTPLCVLKIGEMMRDILPGGVWNIVSGGDRLGPWISGHAGIRKVAFTGSTTTGK